MHPAWVQADDVKKEEKAAARKAVIDEAMTELDEWREQQARENAETGKNGRHGSARPATSTASSVTGNLCQCHGASLIASLSVLTTCFTEQV